MFIRQFCAKTIGFHANLISFTSKRRFAAVVREGQPLQIPLMQTTSTCNRYTQCRV